MNELGAQGVVVGELGKGEGAVPGSGLRVVDGCAVLVGAGDEVLGEMLADLLG